MRKAMIKLFFSLTLLITGCSNASSSSSSSSSTQDQSSSTVSSINTSELFSNRDLEWDYDESESVSIELLGDTIACSSNAVQISGTTGTITEEGTYILSGTLNDGMIIVNVDKNEKVQIVLNNVTIHHSTSSPIYIAQADKVFLTLAEDSINTLTNGGTFTAFNDDAIDAIIFSKEDLTINGLGTLSIQSPGGHGIVSKDELVLTGGTYEILALSHGITGKDDVCLTNVTMEITSEKDGIHAENNDDTTLGFVYIQSGVYTIDSGGDGISASTSLQVDGGTFDITTGDASLETTSQTNTTYGDVLISQETNDSSQPTVVSLATGTSESDTSMKALKATGNLVIQGGVFQLESTDDAVHSNANMFIHGGDFEIVTGDDGFHADDTLTITSGTIDIQACYEGIEALHVYVQGGDILLEASDDGLNAAGGADQSGFGGPRGNDRFQPSSGDGSIEISGGNLHITAYGDGIDANGTLLISGGTTVVVGPTYGDTATLDYDVSGTITGGTFIGTGAFGMAQTFSQATQGVLAVSVGNQAAGTLITLVSDSDETIFSYSPELPYAVVILSSPNLMEGESYTLSVGSISKQFTIS
jgi:hypothetical protein